MTHLSDAKNRWLREPLATTQTRRFRVLGNILMNKDFSCSSFDCANIRQQSSRKFAQSSLINVANHDVISGL